MKKVMEFEIILTNYDEMTKSTILSAIETIYGADSIKNKYFRLKEYRISVGGISGGNVALAKLKLILLIAYLDNNSLIRDGITSIFNMNCYENLYGRITIPDGLIEVTNYIDRNGPPMRTKLFTNYEFKGHVRISTNRRVNDKYEYYPDIGHKYPCENNSKLKSSVTENSIHSLDYKFDVSGQCKNIWDMALMLIYNISRILTDDELLSSIAYEIAYKAVHWDDEKCFKIDSHFRAYMLQIECDVDNGNPIHMIDGEVIEKE